ncbi:TetR/AcrR family transcriptional regulator C-terminal domain-containing protein [Amycolatopsis sp. NPDC059027]|uniref:TetR/AcrR family transcriptional regulator C-terminal domain-containing protein n=1 Tax=Amycolatopsis sp. NPDC059027 TaxID=3346709 RepID=UPI00366B4C15
MSDRRARPRAGLTRERVVDAALEFVDEHGVAALSMRKLGAALDVEAMTLYHYVPNKDALFEALVDRLTAPLGDVLPEPGETWERWLGRLARAYRAELLAHPGVLPLAATRPVTSRAALGHVETALRVLTGAGFEPVHALDVLNTVTTFVLGHTLAEAGRPPGAEQSDVDSAGELDPAEFPLLTRALAAGGRHGERFGFALAALLAGLAAGASGG